MSFIKWLKSLFRKPQKTNEELEDELTEQIITEHEEALREAYEESLPASVIAYEPDESTDYVSAQSVVLVENYTCKMLPSENSILWIPVDGFLRPFKFVRFDFIQTDNEYESMRVYIVVKPAMQTDVVQFT